MHGEFYIAMFQVPNHEEAEKIVRDADPHITAAADAIKESKAFPKTKNNMVYRLMSSAVNPVFYPLFVSAKKFTADSRCTGNCTHCMACICYCSQEAIEYGSKSVGKPRYYFDFFNSK